MREVSETGDDSIFAHRCCHVLMACVVFSVGLVYMDMDCLDP